MALGVEEKVFTEYVRGILRRHPHDEHHIFDVGGAAGTYSEYVRQTFYDVLTRFHIFEPHPQFVDELSRRYADIPDVFVIAEAVGSFQGTAPFARFEFAEHSHLQYLHRPDEPGDVEVTVTTLDAYWKGNPRSIGLLKIDTEGNELEVLKGAHRLLSTGRIRTLQFEYGGSWIGLGRTLPDVAEELVSYGYQMVRYDRGERVLWRVEPRELVDDYEFQNYFAVRREDLRKKGLR